MTEWLSRTCTYRRPFRVQFFVQLRRIWQDFNFCCALHGRSTIAKLVTVCMNVCMKDTQTNNPQIVFYSKVMYNSNFSLQLRTCTRRYYFISGHWRSLALRSLYQTNGHWWATSVLSCPRTNRFTRSPLTRDTVREDYTSTQIKRREQKKTKDERTKEKRQYAAVYNSESVEKHD